MNRRCVPIFLFVACLAGRAAAEAPASKIAVINLRLVYDNMQETIDVEHRLADMREQLDRLTAPSHLAPGQSNQPAEDRADPSKLREQQALRLRLARTEGRQLANGFNEIKSAVQELAASRGLDVVLAYNRTELTPSLEMSENVNTLSGFVFSRTVMFAADEADITNEVIAKLNSQYKSPAPKLPALPTVAMQVGSKTYQLEIAGDEDTRDHGLMERDDLPADHGMIFVFNRAEPKAFWMHHTRFPLDIVFADDGGKVVSVHTMKAYDESAVPSDGPAKYAIELAAGQAAANGVKPGDMLKVPGMVNANVKD